MAKELEDGRFILVDIQCTVEGAHVVIQDTELSRAYNYIQQFTNKELTSFDLKRTKQNKFIITRPILKRVHRWLKGSSQLSPFNYTVINRGSLMFENVLMVYSFTNGKADILQEDLIRVNSITKKLQQYTLMELIDYADYVEKLRIKEDPFLENRKIIIPNTIKIHDLSDVNRFMEQRQKGLILKTNRETRKTTPVKVTSENVVEIMGNSTELIPDKVDRQVTLAKRKQNIVSYLKEMYKDICQVCHEALLIGTNGETLSEVHHIQPLGSHNGSDSIDNMIVLCPNHHAMFDRGAISIELDKKLVLHVCPTHKIHNQPLILKHEINPRYVEYHNEHIFQQTRKCQKDLKR
ncbi:HNH endonuclease [Brevibacillus choshinensis]|uniref:HNH endonuclease n=1 Tax=Brevibacillus choshinensis TaxID=54911 RepID=A0ABX7FIF8_BRECH|nr:HNH endonuclease signature motif containing protein [Brevibacillus choshinensis]QRG66004.1 HNH endonuclease [Brevibacillus choshinensis]